LIQTEGYVTVDGRRLFYRSFGRSERVLVGLHGGPGSTHKYLLPLSSLAGEDLRVVLYDQLGCGGSDHPADHALYTIGRAAENLEGLRGALGLGRVNLLGHSYGGFLALEYALKHPAALDSLILSSTSASVPKTIGEIGKLRAGLPREMQETMDGCEARGDLQDPAYLRCIDFLYHKRICIIDPWPDEMDRLFREWSQDIYREMWGANEFFVTGNLRDWDVASRLGSVAVPTLVTVGRYDELPLPLAEQIHAGIPGSRLRVFEHSSHMAMLEEPQQYLSAISDFLSRRA
jgi:proline-specific peptidase